MQDEPIKLKEYLMLRSFIISFAIILGGVSAILFDYFNVDLLYTLVYLTLISLFSIPLQYQLYKIFKRRIINATLEIE